MGTLLGVLPGLVACATSQDRLNDLIASGGLIRGEVPANGFRLLTLEKPDIQAEQIHVYIEGDGRPWRAGGEVISADPTPRNPLALSWMIEDKQAALYLGRPCYFIQAQQFPCHQDLWTFSRYSETVVVAMEMGLSGWLAGRPQVKKVTLVGHSGGGVLALLLAERIPEVNRVIAVATPIDHQRWTRLHGYSPLDRSINPADITTWRAGIERIFVFGEQDKNVPYREFSSIAAHIGAARTVIIGDMPHDACCGRIGWQDFLSRLH